MRLLAVLLIVSFVVHLGLLAIPLPEKKLEKKEVIPVSILDYKTLEQKKEQPKKQQKPKPKLVEKKAEPKKEIKKDAFSIFFLVDSQTLLSHETLIFQQK